jgi:hypothetical protein
LSKRAYETRDPSVGRWYDSTPKIVRGEGTLGPWTLGTEEMEGPAAKDRLSRRRIDAAPNPATIRVAAASTLPA